MNGLAQQPSNPGDSQMKKAPDAWTQLEWERALAIIEASKKFDAAVVANPIVRFLKAAKAQGRGEINAWDDFPKGERAALTYLRKRAEEESKVQGFIPLTDEEYFEELLKNQSMRDGLHPEDDTEIRKVIDSM